MSQYPNPPQPQPQWQGQWQPPLPHRDRHPGRGPGCGSRSPAASWCWFSVSSASRRSQHPGFWSTTTTPTTAPPPASPGAARRTRGRPGGQPDVPIPPPNASAPESEPGSPDEPDPPPLPEGAAPAGDPAGFAQDYLARVAAGDAAGVDEAMCAADQEWQYEDAVSEGRVLGLSEPRADDTAPGGLLADLTGPEGTVDGRITVVPDDADGWCIDVFYVF